LNSKDKQKERYSVALFHSISGALRAEKLLKAESISIKLIPVPRHLSSDCGICVRFAREDESKVKEILTQNNLQIQNICPI
jgi:Putative Se/S carrier protein-like